MLHTGAGNRTKSREWLEPIVPFNGTFLIVR